MGGVGKRTLTKSEQMSRVRTKNTSPEMIFRRALWRSGIRYRLHPTLPGKPDLIFVKKRIAVFIDGCFWHGCPLHYTAPQKNADFWKTKIEKNRLRDIKVTADLETMGWTVLRFWEHEVETEMDTCTQRIMAAVKAP